MAVYSKEESFLAKEIELPATWGDIEQVQLLDLTINGLKRSLKLKVRGNTVKLDIRKNHPLILMPVSSFSKKM